MLISTLTALVATALLSSPALSQTLDCYMPNGTSRNTNAGAAPLENYSPCVYGGKQSNPSLHPSSTCDKQRFYFELIRLTYLAMIAGHSMCCRKPGQSGGDICTSDNRFCDGGSNIWRESCTDPTWQDPACKKLFLNGTGYQGSPHIYGKQATL